MQAHSTACAGFFFGTLVLVPDWSTSELTMFGLAGLYVGKEFFVPAVKNAFTFRQKATEEASKKVESRLDALEQKQSKHDGELTEVRYKTETAQQNLTNQLNEIKGQLNQLDRRIAEQGKYHDDKLAEALSTLSTDFNRRLTTTLISELEHKVREVLRSELDERKGRARGER